MQFWLRHLFLMVTCVVLPFGLALYFDTVSEIDRSKTLGDRATAVALTGLRSRLELEAFALLADAREMAEEAMSDRELDDLVRPSDVAAAAGALAAGVPENGFAWLVDARGDVLVRHDQSEPVPPERRRSVAGQPAFVRSQLGFELDTVMMRQGRPHFVATVPLIRDGAARGAIMLGHPVDDAWLERIGNQLSAFLAFGNGDQVWASTLDDDAVAAFRREEGFKKPDATHFGRLGRALPASMPGLPLMVDSRAEGLAYTARHKPMPGSQSLQWMVAIRSGDSLRDLPERQLLVLGGLLASLMLSVLIGLINSRTFVRPIGTIEHHLSEIQMGRGELELSERKVASPYRRLVRLINMTVQKIPSRGLSSITDRPAWGDEEPPRPSSTPPPQPVPARPVEEPFTLEPPVERAPSRPEPPASPPPEAQLPTGNLATQPLASSDMMFAEEPEAQASADLSSEADAVAAALEQLQQTEGLPPSEAGAVTEQIPEMSPEPEAVEPEPPSGRPSRRSAGEIRGGLPRVNDLDDSMPVELAGTGPAPAAGGVRAGGSAENPWDLSAGAGLRSGTDERRDSTVVAPVAQDLLAKSAARDDAEAAGDGGRSLKESTVVASVPEDLIHQSRAPDPNEPDAEDHSHFREVYDRFVQMRRRCGEPTDNLAFERFVQKLHKNREAMIQKYGCRTVRFQVYEKDGKAALKASPVRAGR